MYKYNKLFKGIITKLIVVFLVVGLAQSGFAATKHKHKKHKAVTPSTLAAKSKSKKVKATPAPKAAIAAVPTAAVVAPAISAPVVAAPAVAIPPVVGSTEVSAPVAAAPTPVAAPAALGNIPSAPDFDVASYVLIDANSGYVMAEKNSNQRVMPASITKVMTLYVTAGALKSGKIHLTDQVAVSENAWRTGGSRMFIKVGSQVAIEDLIKGIATASGNDASVAMAEHLAGSEPSFITLMNQTAHDLKMDGSNFADSNGLPNPNNYSTAADLATLGRAWITNYPEYYHWFKEKWITYNGIKQPNRNRLLWRDPTVDGMKTGHTEEAGYCLLSSAVRNGMRLIAVVMGAKNDVIRNNASVGLLNYGYRFFESRKLFAANTSLTSPKTLFGKDSHTALGLPEDMYITLPAGQHKDLKAKAKVADRLKAPIIKGQVCGSLDILDGNKVIFSKPLVALKDNPKTNFIFAMFDYITVLFNR